MSVNNSVKDGWGNVIGYRCRQCGDVFESMWDNTCNGCREGDRKHKELVAEIKELREQLAKKEEGV